MFIRAQVAWLSVHSDFHRAEGLYWHLSQNCWSRAARAVLVIVRVNVCMYVCLHVCENRKGLAVNWRWAEISSHRGRQARGFPDLLWLGVYRQTEGRTKEKSKTKTPVWKTSSAIVLPVQVPSFKYLSRKAKISNNTEHVTLMCTSITKDWKHVSNVYGNAKIS